MNQIYFKIDFMDPSKITKKANLVFSVTLDDHCFFAAIAEKCCAKIYSMHYSIPGLTTANCFLLIK